MPTLVGRQLREPVVCAAKFECPPALAVLAFDEKRVARDIVKLTRT